MSNPALTIIHREFLSPHRGRQPLIQVWGDGSLTILDSASEDAHGVVLTREQVEEMFAKWHTVRATL